MFLDRHSKSTEISNFIRIRPLGSEFSMRTNRRTGRHNETNNRFSQFCERA